MENIMTRATAATAVLARSRADDRALWLRAVADALDAARDELVETADRETHLGTMRLSGEVARTTGQLRLFAEVALEGSYIEATIDHAGQSNPDLRRMLRPIGPVAVYAASNFPFAFSIAGGDTASALAVGCPVVVKAHPGHPATSRLTASIVARSLADSGAPDGTFALVEGYEAGIELVQHPAVVAASFTGSLSGGRALHDLAAARPDPIPFYGELGSINPVVVTEAADADHGDELAEGLAGSFTLGTGQFCTKPGVVFVPTGSRLEQRLAEMELPQGRTMLSHAIDAGFSRGVDALLGVPGVERVAGTVSGSLAVAIDARDFAAESDRLLTEVFGPVTVLVRYGHHAELQDLLTRLTGSLTATLHADAEHEDVTDLVMLLERVAGRVLFSGWPTGVAVTWAQHHGGPWPATTSQFTSVGATAVRRFLRPIAYQDAPEAALPPELRDGNPLGIPRRVDGVLVPAV